MGAGEMFTVLAVVEATDKISKILERIDGAFDSLGDTAERTAQVVTAAGADIDESLLRTASGADAVGLADARLEAAQARLAASTKAQADAETALLAAREKAATAAEGDTEATTALAAAGEDLAKAQKKVATATRDVEAAQSAQAATARAAAAADEEAAGTTDAAAASQAGLRDATDATAASAGLASKAFGVAGLAVAAIGYESVKAAANFQSMTEHLVTDAGESQKNIAMVRTGMLQIAQETGTTTDQMAAGMYHIESAGYHGTAALNVLKTAAEGAKVGGADLDTIGQALTGTMNAFGKSAGTPVQMMNALIATVGQGDMKLQALGSSLGNVAAIAGAAGLQYAQVGGAIATMTAQNMSAQRATQDLAHTISSLQNPTQVQINEMQAMGLDSNSLAKNLGKTGLTGTFAELTKAVAAHTKDGSVLISTFKSSAQAASDANTMIKAMPPSLQKLAQGYLSGSTSLNQWRTTLKGLPPIQAAMMSQFATLANKTHTFNDLLKSGSPAAQTFNAAMAKMLGGTTGLNTALMLTGGHAATFDNNVKLIGEAASKSGSSVDNWGKIQQTLSQKLDRAKATVESLGINIGTVLLPAVSGFMDVVMDVIGPIGTFIGQHQRLAGLVLAVAGGMLAAAAGIKAVTLATKAWAAVQKLIDGLMAIFDAEADANPIGLIVIAIAALVAGLIYAYTHFKTFRDVVNDVGKFVAASFVGLWHVLDAVFHAIVAAAEGTWHGLQAAWNAVIKAAQAVWHALETAWNAVMSVTSTVWNAIKGFFEKWWPLLLVIFLPPIALLLAIWNHFHTQIEQVAETVWSAIKDFFTTIWGAIKTAASAVWDAIRFAIVNPIEALWADLEALWNKIKPWLEAAWNGIKSVAETVWNAIRSAIINPLTSAWHDVTNIVGKIASAIETALRGAWNAVKNIGSWFLSIGEDIVHGIVSGVENAAGGLFSSLKNLASSALSSAKSFLGIGSPSKKFRDEVGKWIPGGIAQGVLQYANTAQSAVRSLASSLTGSARTAVTGTLSVAGAGLPAVGSAGAGGVTLTIDLRGATVASDQSMNLLAAKVGKQVTKSLAQAGVHVRM